MARQTLTKGLRGGLLVLACVAFLSSVWQGWRWLQAEQFNQALAQQDYLTAARYPGAAGAFAQAYAVQQQGAFRASVEASAALPELPPPLALRRDYNLATLYLERGLQELQQGQQELAWPLLELAKSTLRAVLRRDSRHWQAKFNLERALALLPDPIEGPPPPRVQPNFSRRSLVKTPGRRELP